VEAVVRRAVVDRAGVGLPHSGEGSTESREVDSHHQLSGDTICFATIAIAGTHVNARCLWRIFLNQPRSSLVFCQYI
jgi:hypothetical protein